MAMTYRLGHCRLPYLHGAAVLHRLYGSLSRPAILGSDACAPGETVMDDETADKSAGVLAVVAGLIAAVKLARVESREIQSRSPRVRSIISECHRSRRGRHRSRDLWQHRRCSHRRCFHQYGQDRRQQRTFPLCPAYRANQRNSVAQRDANQYRPSRSRSLLTRRLWHRPSRRLLPHGHTCLLASRFFIEVSRTNPGNALSRQSP
jgi:hypothetical protein